MAEFPDIYGDGFSVTAGGAGVTLTITLTQPTGDPAPHEEPVEPVVRVRLSRETARQLADALTQVMAASGQSVQSSGVKH